MLRIDDSRPAALQERLWGPALRLVATLMAERPDLHWAVSARAPALETLAMAPPHDKPAEGGAVGPG